MPEMLLHNGTENNVGYAAHDVFNSTMEPMGMLPPNGSTVVAVTPATTWVGFGGVNNCNVVGVYLPGYTQYVSTGPMSPPTQITTPPMLSLGLFPAATVHADAVERLKAARPAPST